MKKSFTLGLLVLGLGLTSLMSCSPNNPSSTGGGSNNSSELNKEESLKLQSVTALNLIKNGNNQTSLVKKKVMPEQTQTKIIAMLPNLEIMLDNNGAQIESYVENVNIAGENGISYNIKETYSFEGQTYTLLYYKDTNVPLSDVKSKNEVKVIERITGLAFLEDIGPVENIDLTKGLNFYSVLEQEQEKNEFETERTLVIETGVNSYVKVSEEIEKEGNEESHEFSYRAVENNVSVLDYSVEIETERNNKQISYELDNEEYEMTRYTQNNETFFRVEYESENGFNEEEYQGIFKKIITTLEDGKEVVSYVFVK